MNDVASTAMVARILPNRSAYGRSRVTSMRVPICEMTGA